MSENFFTFFSLFETCICFQKMIVTKVKEADKEVYTHSFDNIVSEKKPLPFLLDEIRRIGGGCHGHTSNTPQGSGRVKSGLLKTARKSRKDF